MSEDYRLKTDPVQWHEGMPLAPQHFQLNDYRYYSIQKFLLESLGGYNWGVSQLDIDPLLLAKGVFRVLSVQAIMPDGSLVNYQEHSQLPRLELPLDEVKFRSDEPQKVYLALPALVSGQPSASGNTPRYISTAGDLVVDENGSAGEAFRVPRLAPNLYLIIGQVPSKKFVSFPIAEVSKQDGQYRLTSYAPPCLYFSPKHQLRSQLEDLAVQMRSKVVYTLERYDMSSDSPTQEHTRKTIDVLTGALLPFEMEIASERAHPRSLYKALIEVVSKLLVLDTKARVVPNLNEYDHLNIYEIFRILLKITEKILAELSDHVQIRRFQKKRGYFGLSLPSVWHTKKIIIGVRGGDGATRAVVHNWIENSLIGTERFVQSIIDRRITGARRRIISPDERQPFSVPKDVVLVEVEIDPQFVSLGEVLYVFNPSDKVGTRPADVYHYVMLEDL